MKKHLVASYCSSAGSYSATSRRFLKIAIAKRCRLHELIRQRFAVALKIQQEDFALMFNQQARRISSRKIQQKRKRSSSRLGSAGAKQLTTYEELRRAGCQLLSSIQMVKATEACKRKGRKYCSCVGTLQRSVALKWKEDKIAFWSAEEFWKLSNGKIFLQRLYIRGNAH
ncbi:hypothetical protein F511_42353 [Dorcoceras hygrometricum]|uniref:Uncharacterized protein n=1 Tax=Dorcoceras hygrometricum TaxID=472368 RepID=A0A2Z7DBE3_9LAMI|nr:hypothetical protein F511_42353 [Dorcoceras hygrometricum]